MLKKTFHLVGDADDFSKRGSFRCVQPQIRHEKEYVRRVTVGALKRDGSGDVKHNLRGVFKIALL